MAEMIYNYSREFRETAQTELQPWIEWKHISMGKHGKGKLFRLWGYTEADAQWLKEEIERQGLRSYLAGRYTLNKLDHNGQRINIVVTIPRKDKSGEVSFTTGWAVYPQGHIQLATPYGDA